MKYDKMTLSPYQGKAQKRFTATFINSEEKKKKTVHFGQRGGRTYIDPEVGPQARDAWHARHSKAGENWSDPLTAGALSKHILWGDSKSLTTNYKQFKKRFNL